MANGAAYQAGNSMTATGDPRSARAYARAMEGSGIEAMPSVPPEVDDLPADVSPEDITWEETIASGGYTMRRLARGSY